MTDIPCYRCSHKQEEHLSVELSIGSNTYLCTQCQKYEHGAYAGICDYKPDNLKMLENLSD